MGSLSPGGVHSHQDHAVALAKILRVPVSPRAFHAFMDGRDTPPRAGAEFIARLVADLPPPVRVATVSGRYYAMDRDNRWERVSKAYARIVDGKGRVRRSGGRDRRCVWARRHGRIHRRRPPSAIISGMRDGDGVLCFNFRADRVRECSARSSIPKFSGFPRARTVRFAAAAGMTEYWEELNAFLQALFPPQPLSNILGEIVARAGRTQLRMAETEKYPHVTYFLNGGRGESPTRARIASWSPRRRSRPTIFSPRCPRRS